MTELGKMLVDMEIEKGIEGIIRYGNRNNIPVETTKKELQELFDLSSDEVNGYMKKFA
ncbi:MAG: hypothetical protein IJ374_06440 [Lachnospiraceae bacterium]|nr:hypothetical protein [Lachnospiraceae bacterium]